MPCKEPLPGFYEADSELQCAILKVTIETRVLLRHLNELRKQVNNSKRYRSTENFNESLVDYLREGMAGNLQRINRQVNTARKAVLTFLEKNSED
jgi:ribosomal protein S15P/S13E